ncbi:MAG: hypothetical protein ABJA16_04615 [Nakamurella sp.]
MQRGTGLVVLVAAVALAVIPSWRPRAVDGTASAVPVAGPPAIGDCVSDPVEIYPGYGNTTGATYVYPQLGMAPCTGPRFAEVVTVIPTPAEPQVTVEGSSLTIVDANQNRCEAASPGYVGTTAVIDVAGRRWSPVVSVQPSLSRPSPRQEAAGQHWLACLSSAPGARYLEQAPAPYDGTLRDAIATGAVRDRIDACPVGTSLDTGFSPGGCTRAHTSQLLAVAADLTADTSREQLIQGCASTAATLTGLPDPTAQGELRIVAQVGPSPAADPVPAGSTVLCGVATAGERTLSGGLIGLGDRPLPWT